MKINPSIYSSTIHYGRGEAVGHDLPNDKPSSHPTASPVGWPGLGEAIGDKAVRFANVLADCLAPTMTYF
ncbi:MAG: hypothetical protein H6667_11855 [Ardenticatenaceae bacterium]|nr:hypothetical protein [Ardenticatenaceae bacterium]MCB9442904.1 hypothetical protein [Ardenticatenaceae bacterium]